MQLSLLVFVSALTATRQAGDSGKDLETVCPLNMEAMRVQLLYADQLTPKGTYRLGRFLDEGKDKCLQASQVNEAIQKTKDGITKLDDRLDVLEQKTESHMKNLAETIAKMPVLSDVVDAITQKLEEQLAKLEQNERNRDLQIATFGSQLSKTQSEITQRVETLGQVGVRLDESEQRRQAQITSLEEQLSKMGSPLLNSVESHFTEANRKFAALERQQKSLVAELKRKFDLTTNEIKHLRRGMKEELFKCGKAMKLELTVTSTGTYYFSPNISNWNAAKTFCDSNEMRLAKIQNEHKLRQVDLAAPNPNAWYWVDAWDGGRKPGQFYWADSEEERVDSSLWDKGQPSSFGSGYEACVFLYTANSKLGDYNCVNKEFFVCELPSECLQLN